MFADISLQGFADGDDSLCFSISRKRYSAIKKTRKASINFDWKQAQSRNGLNAKMDWECSLSNGDVILCTGLLIVHGRNRESVDA